GDGRPGECLRRRDARPVGRLLLSPAPNDTSVRGRPELEELALPALRLEQDDLPVGQGNRERDPGRTAAGADVDDRSLVRAHELDRTQRICEQSLAREALLADSLRAV